MCLYGPVLVCLCACVPMCICGPVLVFLCAICACVPLYYNYVLVCLCAYVALCCVPLCYMCLCGPVLMCLCAYTMPCLCVGGTTSHHLVHCDRICVQNPDQWETVPQTSLQAVQLLQ